MSMDRRRFLAEVAEKGSALAGTAALAGVPGLVGCGSEDRKPTPTGTIAVPWSLGADCAWHDDATLVIGLDRQAEDGTSAAVADAVELVPSCGRSGVSAPLEAEVGTLVPWAELRDADGGVIARGTAPAVTLEADAALTAQTVRVAAQPRPDAEQGPETLFSHGVASGDPTERAVILWTRISPADEDSNDAVTVFWQIAADSAFESVVDAGVFATDRTRDWTVKVEPTHLAPATTYYYRFVAQQRTSPIGRTRTAPDAVVDALRFAVCSCSNMQAGYFHGYKEIAAMADLDGVIHLGDYFYEYGSKGPDPSRDADPPWETVTLADYRRRHAQYKADQWLGEAHRQHPFITVWDDHESANDSWLGGAQQHNPEQGEGEWQDRKLAAMQAYREWMPIREATAEAKPELKIWRKLSYGPLMDLFLLDTRLWGRVEQTTPGQKEVIDDPERTLLGLDQEAWLFDGMRDSFATWKVLGQQVMMAPLQIGGTVLNTDQWDGYGATRDRLFSTIRDHDISGVVTLTGDIHTSWASELTDDPEGDYDPETSATSVGVEFVCPGVTSPGLDAVADVAGVLDTFNPHIKWFNLTQRGFYVLDVREDAVQATWHLLDSVFNKDSYAVDATHSYRCDVGTRQLVADDTPRAAPVDPPPLAP